MGAQADNTQAFYFIGLPQTVATALAEDIGSGDVSAALIPADTQAEASIYVREDAIICGQQWANETFQQVDPSLKVDWLIEEGSLQTLDTKICKVSGSAKSILTAERTALNFLQTLSGTANTVAQYASILENSKTQILDTRKTIPGLRLAQKYAVTQGGGMNHRIGLYDRVLIKENHIMAAGSITAAIQQAKSMFPDILVETETENLAEVELALEAKADIIMLDDFTLQNIRKAVQTANGKALLEISGNVTLENLSDYAETGVDYISSGSLTKHVKATDLSMRFSQ